MTDIGLDVFVKTERKPKKRIVVQQIHISDQGLIPWRECHRFTMFLSGRWKDTIRRLSNHDRVKMIVVDKGKPRLRWTFDCSVQLVASKANTTIAEVEVFTVERRDG